MKYCPKCEKTYPTTQRFCLEDGALLSLRDPFHLVGRTLVEKYRIDALVGIGGMGAVYCAYHTGIERRVAVKILLPHLAIGNDRVVELFEREAKIAGRLSHENIADIKDAGHTADGIAYLVMEWIEGRTLEDEIEAGGAMSLERTRDILRQIAAALDEAHDSFIVHRDLKPSNIMLTRRPDGTERVKVLDFGISKILTNSTGSPISSIIGTPQYASPEQFRLDSKIDGRSDIYSLGVILFQMLTGSLPYEASSMHELMRLHLTFTPPPPRSLRPEIPESLDRLISRMLSKQPEARPQRAGEVYQMFTQASHQPPALPAQDGGATNRLGQELVPTEELPEKSLPAEATNAFPPAAKSKTMLIGSLIGLLLVGIVVVYAFYQYSPSTPVAMETAPSSTTSPAPETPTPAPAKGRKVAVTDAAPTPAITASTPAPVKSVTGAYLMQNVVKRVDPAYPRVARDAKIEDAVIVDTTVSEQGRVIGVVVVSGHPLLREPTLKAARQWTFKPTYENGRPVPVRGTLTFNYTLQ